ncbi:MAG: HYR domain-containing protein, partial [Nitrosopumilus sp.]|nr:HYR domain-containing protein [Nitrosopumilus sp.]
MQIAVIVSFTYTSQSVSYAQVPGTQFVDTVPPTINISADPIISEASGPLGSIVNFNVTATDGVSDNINLQCIPPPGSIFRIGDTTVVCTATDISGNEKKESFEVKIQDTIPPSTELGTYKTSWMGEIGNQEYTISDDIGFGFSGFDIVGIEGFECKIDEKNWQPSTIKYQLENRMGCYYMNLEQGQHTFQVRAIDTSGNKDPNPEIFSWTIITLKDAINELRERITLLDLPFNLKSDLLNSLDNAINNIQENESYDHLICEYIDSFNYGFSRASVSDFITEDDTDFIGKSILAIRDRTGCNSPIVDPGNERIIDEGTTN